MQSDLLKACLVGLIAFFCASLAEAQERIALLIGNGAYQSVTALPNPINDATDVAEKLAELGFDVTVAQDSDRAAMRAAIAQFGADLRAAGADGQGLFYYAGHAVQVQGANILLPTDAAIRKEDDLIAQGVLLSDITDVMAAAESAASFLIIDACRNDPFEQTMNLPSGLAQMRAPRRSIVAYSTEPGAVAFDGIGRNSPYTAALLEEISKPGVPVEKMFKSVRRKLLEATQFQQISWESSSLVDENIFAEGEPQTAEPEIAFEHRPRHPIDWEDLNWSDLSAKQRMAWTTLGWTQSSWQGQTAQPESENLIWDALSRPQQEAARDLGYSRPMWDGTAVVDVNALKAPPLVASPGTDWEVLDWSDLTAPQRAAWTVLGWDALSWSGQSAEPTSGDNSWSDLNADERSAAASLGYDSDSW